MADEAQQEILISYLQEFDATGFEQNEHQLLAYFPANNFNSYDVTQALEGYEYTTSEIAEQNWNEAWERSFQPVKVENFCGIRASFHPPMEGVQHEIVITPKMSFGTGHHATTFMMLQQMRHLIFSDQKVLDFGTGTGVLSIMAEKLGAASVCAIDIDEWSITNAQENIEKNNCKRIELQLASEVPKGSFGIILANINRNVILDSLDQLVESLDNNGMLLISGLLQADTNDLLQITQESALRLVKQKEMNQWASFLFTKDVSLN
jgi:ribosomal protein L11 methyltransferase